MQADRAGYVNGADRYQFVQSGPINRRDPLGLWSWSSFGQGLLYGAAAVAVGVAVVAVVAATGGVAAVAIAGALGADAVAAAAAGTAATEAINWPRRCIRGHADRRNGSIRD